MKCPSCHCKSTRVQDSRPYEDHSVIRRRRQCTDCGLKFFTIENTVKEMPVVIKKDGRREAFSKEKLKKGLEAACQKRPISQNQIHAIVDRIQNMVIKKGGSEISSDLIGKYVMSELRKLDEVAYVRFASVYITFKEVNEFFQSLGSEFI